MALCCQVGGLSSAVPEAETRLAPEQMPVICWSHRWPGNEAPKAAPLGIGTVSLRPKLALDQRLAHVHDQCWAVTRDNELALLSHARPRVLVSHDALQVATIQLLMFAAISSESLRLSLACTS